MGLGGSIFQWHPERRSALPSSRPRPRAGFRQRARQGLPGVGGGVPRPGVPLRSPVRVPNSGDFRLPAIACSSARLAASRLSASRLSYRLINSLTITVRAVGATYTNWLYTSIAENSTRSPILRSPPQPADREPWPAVQVGALPGGRRPTLERMMSSVEPPPGRGSMVFDEIRRGRQWRSDHYAQSTGSVERLDVPYGRRAGRCRARGQRRRRRRSICCHGRGRASARGGRR